MSDSQPIEVNLQPGITYYWCRCGRSGNQPFCDGAHQGSEVTPLTVTVNKPSPAWLCTCKKTATPPYCDGSHKQ